MYDKRENIEDPSLVYKSAIPRTFPGTNVESKPKSINTHDRMYDHRSRDSWEYMPPSSGVHAPSISLNTYKIPVEEFGDDDSCVPELKHADDVVDKYFERYPSGTKATNIYLQQNDHGEWKQKDWHHKDSYSNRSMPNSTNNEKKKNKSIITDRDKNTNIMDAYNCYRHSNSRGDDVIVENTGISSRHNKEIDIPDGEYEYEDNMSTRNEQLKVESELRELNNDIGNI
jgi:hypothetical protein